MTTLWTSDCCDCEIEFDENQDFVSWFNKCEIHKNINDNALLSVVLTHNRNFGRRFPFPITADQKRLIIQDKRDEKARIRNLGNGTRRRNK